MSDTSHPEEAPTGHPQLDVIYENAEILVMNKPADVPMDGDRAVYATTVESMVYDYMKAKGIFDAEQEILQQERKRKKQLKFVHQLDYSTSGVLCLAFTKDMAARLAHCFEMRTSRKYYVAILSGHVPGETTPATHVTVGSSSNCVTTRLPSGARVDSLESNPCFAAWVAQCREAWAHVGAIQALPFSHLWLDDRGRSETDDGPAQHLRGPTTSAAGNEVYVAAGMEKVHRYPPNAPALSGAVTRSSNDSVESADDMGSFVVRQLARLSLHSPVVSIHLPVGYDISDPEHLRMAVTTADGNGRDATTSLVVLKRTYLRIPLPLAPTETTPRSKVESAGMPVTLVLLAPHTGRRHQLRVHCRALGFPIFGDSTYDRTLPWCPPLPSTHLSSHLSAKGSVAPPRMYLHAWRLQIPGVIAERLDRTKKVELKKKRRRETLGITPPVDALSSTASEEWTEFVAPLNFPGLELGE